MRRATLLFTLLLASCANIIDLEDRKLGDAGSTTTNPPPGNDSGPSGGGTDAGMPFALDDGGFASLDCTKYCAETNDLCTTMRMVQDYSTPLTCLAVCTKFSLDPSTTGNTLACRLDQLNRLVAAGGTESQTYCPPAGPSGGPAPGEAAGSGCGTDCQGFCALRTATCPDLVEPDCVTKCAALPTTGMPYNADANFGSGSDTLECRLAHLSAATLYDTQGRNDDRISHCSHSGIRSKVQCDVNGTAPLKCSDVCKLIDTACTGDSAVFESDAQCQAFCNKLTPGTMSDDSTLATQRCLRAAAYDALEQGINSRLCSNANPAPDRCGSGRCQGYCTLAQQGCPTQFAAKYPGGMADCMSNCGTLMGSAQNDSYSVTASVSKSSSQLQCRLLHVTRVLAGDANSCADALGGGSCQ